MKTKQIAVLLAVLALAMPLAAQMGFGSRMPDMSGIWHPVVGSGGSYEITNAEGKKSQVEITIVGKEDMAGKDGFWMEMAVVDPRSGGNTYMKYLFAPGAGMTKMIMQMPGQDPMEMDMSMMGARGPAASPTASATPSDIRAKAELVGTESVTVPAGTFSCEHYRAKDGSGDAWISDKVAPWGLVKTQGKSSMVLVKVITDAKDHITGTPKKFDPMQMMRGGAAPGKTN
jgi:hypothetical protein